MYGYPDMPDNYTDVDPKREEPMTTAFILAACPRCGSRASFESWSDFPDHVLEGWRCDCGQPFEREVPRRPCGKCEGCSGGPPIVCPLDDGQGAWGHKPSNCFNQRGEWGAFR